MKTAAVRLPLHACACQLLASCACSNDLAHLSRGTGVAHGHFHDCVTAVSLAIRNPGNEELSISAIKLMQTISRRLAESDPQVRVPVAADKRQGYMQLQ